jgi:hypothetical protein
MPIRIAAEAGFRPVACQPVHGIATARFAPWNNAWACTVAQTTQRLRIRKETAQIECAVARLFETVV